MNIDYLSTALLAAGETVEMGLTAENRAMTIIHEGRTILVMPVIIVS